jgi:hypothetical protein
VRGAVPGPLATSVKRVACGRADGVGREAPVDPTGTRAERAARGAG